MQDPERHLGFAQGLPCPVNRDRAAVIDAGHRAFVGHDVYFFSDQKAKARFLADPLRYCGRLTDPVSRERFVPTARSPQTLFRGRPYFFVSPQTLAQFKAMPDSFAVRKGA